LENISREEKCFLFLGASFIALLVVSNIIAVKVVSIGGLVVPAAVICYALTFAITDTMSEVWGKERTKFIITLGFFASVISAAMIQLAILLPAAPFWELQSEYQLILGANLRIVTASLTAYLVSQYHDIWAFHFWKKVTKEKHLWLRNNFSTWTSQLIDSVLFITIAFYGTGTPILAMIFGQYLIKITIAAMDTPLVYLLVGMVRKFMTPVTGEVKKA